MEKLEKGTRCTGTVECEVYNESHVNLIRHNITLPIKIDVGGGIEIRQIQIRCKILRLYLVKYPTVASQSPITYKYITEFPSKETNVINDVLVICRCEGKTIRIGGFEFKNIFKLWNS